MLDQLDVLVGVEPLDVGCEVAVDEDQLALCLGVGTHDRAGWVGIQMGIGRGGCLELSIGNSPVLKLVVSLDWMT